MTKERIIESRGIEVKINEDGLLEADLTGLPAKHLHKMKINLIVTWDQFKGDGDDEQDAKSRKTL